MNAFNIVGRIGNIIWLALSVVLLIWVAEGLFGVDRSTSIFPMVPGASFVDALMVGVAWGLLLVFGAGDFVSRRVGGGVVSAARAGSLTALAVGTVLETRRTGTEINDVPQYDVFVKVVPAAGEPFIGRVRMLLDAVDASQLQPGAAMAVRYDPQSTDRVAFANLDEPEVQRAMVEWRITRGLLDPRLVQARRNGIVSPASVLELRPTGRRLDGQVEVQLRLLVTPLDGSAPWEVDTASFLMPQALSHVQVGSPVYAQYEPHAPQLVALRLEIEQEQVR